MKRRFDKLSTPPDRFPRESCDQSLMSALGLRWTRVTVKPVRSELAGVVATEGDQREVESLRSMSYLRFTGRMLPSSRKGTMRRAAQISKTDGNQ